MKRNYLQSCLLLHRIVTELRFKRAQPLDRIADDVREVFSGWLTCEVNQTILNRNLWNPDMFGFWPPVDELKRDLGEGLDLRQLPDGEDEVIRKLLEVYRQIEPVSVVLRFVQPKDYGIVSAPVEKMLGIAPDQRQSDRYLRYTHSLRELRDGRGFDTAAQVDMALWALQVGILDGGPLKRDAKHAAQARAIEAAFDDDIGLQQLRTRNLIKPLFDEFSELRLAEALLPTDFEIAGKLAGIEFECWIRRWLGKGAYRDDKNSLHDVIRTGCYRQNRSSYEELDSVRKTRNDAIHDPERLTSRRVQKLIAAAKKAKECYRAQWSSG